MLGVRSHLIPRPHRNRFRWVTSRSDGRPRGVWVKASWARWKEVEVEDHQLAAIGERRAGLPVIDEGGELVGIVAIDRRLDGFCGA